jgi:hypothetical protein
MDFSNMTPEEREQHYLKVCEQIKLPPELRLLEFYWVDGGDGGRKLVLWAPKGACDLLREIHGISITGLTQANGDGYVGWVATGTNKAGRTEMSTGAVSTRGLSGENLAKAVAFAQTRACRRVTLAFIGCGILDESELHEMTTSINSAATLPVPIMPTVQPSVAAASVVPAQADPAVPIQAYSVVQNPPKEGVSLQTIVTSCDKPKRGPGPRRTTAPLASRAHEAVVELETIPSSFPAQKLDIKDVAPFTLADAKKKAKHLRSEILEPAGLMPSNDLGNHAKITKFVKAKLGVDDETKITAAQWKEFFDWADQQSAAELIKLIDQAAAQ